ncbi:MAG: hypothetical protein Unbinned2189contig1000_36 [Prokaryotic dsDNA virus sp.]|nr:MAG: hypothetical protein Unbinned2189contig1000_36 [Prokaryotic dsDNA virus sp.]|tara:strand:+ start:273 stop:923 length:651 start_codon:yes stop_codon:yes gene_type:complete
MAQDFERNFITNIGTIAQDIPNGSDFGSDNTIIGIHMANKTDNAITASCFMTSSAFTGNTGDPFAITVTVVSSQYLLDGVVRPHITLLKGFTYVFSYPSAHPFSLSTTSDGTHGGGSEYTTGVTRDSSANTLTVVVSSSTPSTLYYYCGNHANHGGQITVTDVHYLIKDAPIPANSALQVLDGGAKLVVQSGDRMFFQSSTVTSLDVWVSRVDAIS